MTMVMSIAHRLSGLALYAGVLGFIVWLNLLAFAPETFDALQELLFAPAGLAGLFALLWAFCHHLCGGVRHFFWDGGIGLGPYGREWFAWGTFVFGLLLTLSFFFGADYESILRGQL